MALTIAVYSFEDPAYACARLRVSEPARALAPFVHLLFAAIPKADGHVLRQDIPAAADIILIQRAFPCAATAPLLDALFASGKPVIYDTDDDWTTLGPDHPFFPDMAERVPHILETVRRAALVTVSTPELAARLANHNANVRVTPNLLPDSLWRPIPPPDRPVTALGLTGTPAHQADLVPLEASLDRLPSQLHLPMRWVFFGYPPRQGRFAGATVVPFTPDYAAYAAKLPRLGLSIGLAPLADTPFHRAKSPIKWMEYAMCGLPGVFADLPPYQGVVEQERTGLLVGPDPRDWCEAVSRLTRDVAFRRRLASQAQEAVLAHHTLAAQAETMLETWTSVLGERS